MPAPFIADRLSASPSSPCTGVEILADPESIRRYLQSEAWPRFLDQDPGLNLLYSSPEWFAHVNGTEPGRPLLLAVASAEGEAVGLVPLQIAPYAVAFDVKSYALGKWRLRALHVLGSQPLLPNEHSHYDAFFRAVYTSVPDCDGVYLDSVTCDSFLWRYLQEGEEIQKHWHVFVPDGTRPQLSVVLPATFDAYLAKFKQKKRYNLRRQVKQLQAHGDGDLRLMRIDAPDQVPAFLQGAEAVTTHSWQERWIGRRIDQSAARCVKFTDLARQGLLRSYLLVCGGAPCAFVVGYQYRGVFHYVEIGYDQRFASFSPGTVLLYLLLEDLFRHNRPGVVNFGIGDSAYKREFGNSEGEDASILVLRRSLRNRLLAAAQRSFRSLVQSARSWSHKLRRS
jgi:CelD/BcsL family acetyltransferase involved in cellulose biosynthesis